METSESPNTLKSMSSCAISTLKPVEYHVGEIKKIVPVPPEGGDWSEYLHAQIHFGNGKGG